MKLHLSNFPIPPKISILFFDDNRWLKNCLYGYTNNKLKHWLHIIDFGASTSLMVTQLFVLASAACYHSVKMHKSHHIMTITKKIVIIYKI